MLEKNLNAINAFEEGMDILIISVTNLGEESYWQKRLDQMRGQIIKENTLLLVVHEDWDQGAGNALGTLYAFKKARQKARDLYGIDLLQVLKNNQSIGLYHTAGKGTRLAPLTGSEYNGKSRIKLAGCVETKSGTKSITLLEAIVKQTRLFASKRLGRLSVFWGDQIFIPSHEIQKTDADVDLLIKTLPVIPNQKIWEEQEYYKYGLVQIGVDQSFKQMEKLSFEDFQSLKLSEKDQVGLSLGSFSLSQKFLEALLKEFETELNEKKGKLDTDPHFWMPLSWNRETYIHFMQHKGFESHEINSHYDRIQKLQKNYGTPIQLKATDLGPHTLWWDYGNLQAYLRNHLLLLSQSKQGDFLRRFFELPKPIDKTTESLTLKNSLVINSSIESGLIENSVLINVVAKEVHIKNSLCHKVSAQKIDTNESLIYNVAENGSINLRKQIRADSFSKEYGHLKLYNFFQKPISWEQHAKENPLSFAALHQFNKKLLSSEAHHQAKAAHRQVKEAVQTPT